MMLDYSDILPMTRADAVATVERGTPHEVAVALLSIALHEPELAWAESFCLGLVNHGNSHVRGNALLCFGHLARIHGRLIDDSIARIVTVGLRDKDKYVRGQAYAAADDLNHYLEWHVVDLTSEKVFFAFAQDHGWIYDNGTKYDDEHWSEYRLGDLSLLRHRNADVVVLSGASESRNVVWRGPVQCRNDFDMLTLAVNAHKGSQD